jgi:hypothetical protein
MARDFAGRYGKWAVVTGASSGIGREMALGIAGRGVHVALAARSQSKLELLAREIAANRRVEARAIAVDLARHEGLETLLGATRDLDVGLLVNAAGFGSGGRFLDTDPTEEAAMIQVNCTAPMTLAHAFGKRFAARGRGGIVMMSSIVAFQGVPRSANYGATKAYVQSFSEALADELKAAGVDVLASAPGPTESGFAARAGMRFGKAVPASDVARETLDALGRRRQTVPGGLSKLLYASLMTAPRSLRVRIMKRVMASMT